MTYLEQFSFDSPKLFIFYLGGSMKNCQIEMHDVVFVVADSDLDASEKIKAKWCGTEKSLHVDSWLIAENVDGFDITLTDKKPEGDNNHLYFVNLGYYKKGVFGELHYMALVVAKSKKKAIDIAMSKCTKDVEMLHSDNVYDLDDCIQLEEVDSYFIQLKYTGIKEEAMLPINGYQKLRPAPSFSTSDRNL